METFCRTGLRTAGRTTATGRRAGRRCFDGLAILTWLLLRADEVIE